MGEHVATTLVKMLIAADKRISQARVGVLGLTFKENVPDLRNSRVPDIISTLREYSIDALVHDPLASPEQAMAEYGIELQPREVLTDLDALVLAVPHRPFVEAIDGLLRSLREGGVFMDVKSVVPRASLPETIATWSL